MIKCEDAVNVLTAFLLVICRWNQYLDPIPKFLTWLQIRVITTQFSTATAQNTTNFGLYLHLFTVLNSIVALMYTHSQTLSFNYSYDLILQCYDTVGWVI